jgi:phytoene dehydrogenase-like protein
MEPITYANGSTLEDPAITYGIVFSNFMHKGVYTFQGGTDKLITQMKAELESNGVDIRIRSLVEKIELSPDRRVTGVVVNGQRIGCRAIVSNANLKSTIFHLVGEENFDSDFVEEAKAVRLNNSSCQVYIALKPGASFDDDCGDLLFHSEHRGFNIDSLLSRDISSRTFSFYYPKTRPGSDRYLIVSSTNANYSDWGDLSEEDYAASKADLCESTLDCLDQYVPGIREKVDWIEASTPRTFQYYTRHWNGASFGTKFEGLKVSKELPEQVGGLFHAGSVGIIMSGWLGAVNYGVIVANDVDKLLTPTAALT